MVRVIFSMVVWAIAAQWVYNEAKLLTPGLLPYIDAAFSKLQLPTHDQWDADKLNEMLAEIVPQDYTRASSLSTQQSCAAALVPTSYALPSIPTFRPTERRLAVARERGYEIF